LILHPPLQLLNSTKAIRYDIPETNLLTADNALWRLAIDVSWALGDGRTLAFWAKFLLSASVANAY
jgi:hypothetical protein